MRAMSISSVNPEVTTRSQSEQLDFSMKDDKTHQLGRREIVIHEQILIAVSSTPLGQAIAEGLATQAGDHFQKKRSSEPITWRQRDFF